ncbi:FAD-binding oxidoreductase [Tistrella bauzanensis]
MPAAAAALSPSAFIDLLVAITGPRGVITAEGDMAPYLEDWRKLYRGHALAVVRPASTDEVAAIVRLCAGAGVAVVPQGAIPAWLVVPCPMAMPGRSCSNWVG